MLEEVLGLLTVGSQIEQRTDWSRKQLRSLKRSMGGKRFSANLVVDIGGSCQTLPSITANAFPTSGGANAASGAIVGQSCDLLNSDTFCNVNIAGNAMFASGELRIGIQVSDSDTSGTYTDPTSGLPQLPTWVSSGGIIWLNSGGLLGGTLQGAISIVGTTSGSPSSGYAIQSGFNVFAGFQRIGRFARLLMFGSGFYAGNLYAGFVSQNRTTGSGGGFSYQPGSGVINV